MTIQQRVVWSLGAGLGLAAILNLFVVYGWVSGNEESSAFGQWQALMLIAAAGAFLVWYFQRDALDAGGAGSAATPAFMLGALAVASLPLYTFGFFAVLALSSLNYAYTNLSIGPVPNEARKAWIGAALAVIALVAGAVLCIVGSWRLFP